jgi:hypothetical protein
MDCFTLYWVSIAAVIAAGGIGFAVGRVSTRWV